MKDQSIKQENKWIKAIKKNSDEKAANNLIHKYYNEIFAFIYKQTLNQELTKDIAQEIFISALRTIHSFDGRASFRTWLYKVAYSRLIDYYRSKSYKQTKQTQAIEEKDLQGSISFTASIEQKEEVKQVLNVLSRFEWELQEIVRLKIYGEYTFTEIATQLKLSESTVKTKYYATIRKLKMLLEENKDES